MTNSIVLATAKSSLPSFAANGVSYNDIAKMFVTPGWTSGAGNVYQEGLRVSDKIVVTYNIGHGYAHTFLNGIRIFRYDKGKAVLIGERYFNNYWWNDYGVNGETTNLLAEYIQNQCKVLGAGEPDKEYVKQVAEGLVNETVKGTKLLGM